MIYAFGDCEFETRLPEACFRQALAVARRRQVNALEWRAATSLGRLWQRQAKRAEAQTRLADVDS